VNIATFGEESTKRGDLLHSTVAPIIALPTGTAAIQLFPRWTIFRWLYSRFVGVVRIASKPILSEESRSLRMDDVPSGLATIDYCTGSTTSWKHHKPRTPSHRSRLQSIAIRTFAKRQSGRQPWQRLKSSYKSATTFRRRCKTAIQSQLVSSDGEEDPGLPPTMASFN